MVFRRRSAAALAFLALALLMFWPLARNLRSGVPHDVGDPLLNTWIFWWNARAVPFTQWWWNGPAYWPLQDFMALSEHLVGLSVLSTPLQWAGAGPQLAYNIALLLSWPLCAIAAAALGWELTRRADAAFIAGLVFGFNPYRLGQTPHIQVLACWWMPIALLAMHRALRAESLRRATGWILLFAAAWLLQALSNGYFLFYFSVLVAVWIAWFGTRQGRWTISAAIVLAWIVSGLVVVPTLLHYKAVHETLNLSRGLDAIVSYGASLKSFASAPALVWAWPFRPDPRPEQGLYPGIVSVVIVLAGIALALYPSASMTRRRRAVLFLLLGAGAVLLLSALATGAFGAWRIHAGPIRVTGRRADRPLAMAILCLAGIALLDPRVRVAIRSRSALLFYVAVAILGFAMCLGPERWLLGESVIQKPPYWWLMRIPGVDNLRVPTRFALIAVLPLSVAAALAFSRLVTGASARVQTAAFAIVAALLVVDSWPKALPVFPLPEQYTLPAAAQSADAVVELPVGDLVDGDVAAMVRGIRHIRPVANGYTGYFPESYRLIRTALRERDRSILPALASFGRLCLVIDRRLLLARNSRVLTEQAGGKLVGQERDYSFYVMERQARPAAFQGHPIPVLKALPLGWASPEPRLIDGRLDTFWESSGWQRGQEALSAELAAEAPVRAVALSLGRRSRDYPRVLAVDLSVDGRVWQRAWEGPTAGLAYIAAVRDPRQSRITIVFSPHPARFVRLRQTGSSNGIYWSVAELQVLR